MKHLHKYFDCESISDLKNKVREGDESIRPLFDLYDKLKEPFQIEGITVGGTRGWGHLFEEHLNVPESGKMLVMRFDTKNRLLGYKTFSESARAKTIYKYLYTKDTVQFATMVNPMDKTLSDFKDFMDELNDNLSDLGIHGLDFLYFNDQSYYSYREGFESDYFIPQQALDNIGKSKSKTCSIALGLSSTDKQIMNSPNFDRFTHEFVKQEIQGLDVVNQEDEIKNLLKLDHQFNDREYFSFISYDQDNRINSYEISHIGGVNSSIAEPRSAMEQLVRSQTKGIILCHNHPSGNTDPSMADIAVTNRFKLLAELVDKEMYDHYIVSPNHVLSLAEDQYLYGDKSFQTDKKHIQEQHLNKFEINRTEER